MTGKRSENRSDIRPVRQMWLPFHLKNELFASKAESVFPDRSMQLMEAVVERGNLRAALKQVVRNDSGSGIDGMTAKELPGYLKRAWEISHRIKERYPLQQRPKLYLSYAQLQAIAVL